MEKDGVELLLSTTPYKVEVLQEEAENGYPLIRVYCKKNEEQIEVDVNAVLLATGRKPNVHGMDLEKAGVNYNEKEGILIND